MNNADPAAHPGWHVAHACIKLLAEQLPQASQITAMLPGCCCAQCAIQRLKDQAYVNGLSSFIGKEARQSAANLIVSCLNEFLVSCGKLDRPCSPPASRAGCGRAPSNAFAGRVVYIQNQYQQPALTAAHVLTWINLPIVAIVALLVPIYMFSGRSSETSGFPRFLSAINSTAVLPLYCNNPFQAGSTCCAEPTCGSCGALVADRHSQALSRDRLITVLDRFCCNLCSLCVCSA